MTRSSAPAVLIALSLLCAGCSDPNGRRAVSGTVVFQGKPLDQGRVHFTPASPGPSESGAGVKDGKFEIPDRVGLVPGKYKVAVFSYDQTGAKVDSNEIPGEPSAKQFKERIPAKYNVKTDLTAEVTASGSNTFTFTLD